VQHQLDLPNGIPRVPTWLFHRAGLPPSSLGIVPLAHPAALAVRLSRNIRAYPSRSPLASFLYRIR